MSDPHLFEKIKLTSGHCATWNKPVTQRQILYDGSYVRHLEEANSEAESGMEVAGQGDGKGVPWMDAVLHNEQSPGQRWWWGRHSDANELTVTKLHVRKWSTRSVLHCVYLTTIKNKNVSIEKTKMITFEHLKENNCQPKILNLEK